MLKEHHVVKKDCARIGDSVLLRAATRVRGFLGSSCSVPGVSLRFTPGFMLSPASAGYNSKPCEKDWLLTFSRCPAFLICLLLLLPLWADARAVAPEAVPRSLTIAVLDFGDTAAGRRSADLIAAAVERSGLKVLDRDLARAAARGAGYTGSLNLSLDQARDLGAAIGCDFYFTGDAQTIRRTPSSGVSYYEAYASIFLVNAKSGKLIMWDRPALVAPTPEAAEKLLAAELTSRVARYTGAIAAAAETGQQDRAQLAAGATPIEDLSVDDGDARRNGLRPPQPYRRLRPEYTADAARAEAEATIDVMVDVDASGEVARVEVVRWGGFGLDESTVNTVRQLHFFPAMRDGVAVPVRVLLRYNFRRPAR